MRYATTEQLNRLSSASAIVATFDDELKGEALDVASALIDGYLRQRYVLPLVAFVPDVTWAAIAIASYDLLSARGYDPGVQDNGNVRLRYEDAIKWLERVANGEISPDIKDSSNEEESSGGHGIAVRSLPPRWF